MAKTFAEEWLESSGWNGKSLADLPLTGEDFRLAFDLRSRYINKFGFAVLTEKVVQNIQEVVGKCPILEVGAGTGYWSHELRLAGHDVIATDPTTGVYYPNGTKQEVSWHGKWAPVEPLTALEAIESHATGRALLMVWPDMNEWPAEALRAYGHKGKTLIHVGEGRGGCTGSAELYDIIGSDWYRLELIAIPRFMGINDYLQIYQRCGT